MAAKTNGKPATRTDAAGSMNSPRRVVGDLTPAPYNPRKIDAERLRMLGDSMGEFGDLSGIVFNRRTGRLIGGHQRIKHIPESAAVHVEQTYEEPTQAGTVAEGFVEVAGERWVYREVDVDETREAAMNVAANKHGGEFDFASLPDLLSELDAGGFDMPLTGFTDKELEGILVHDNSRGVDDADLTPPEEPKSKRGEVYELGPHRLMCGDATDASQVDDLLLGTVVDMLWSDPPYGKGGYAGRSGKFDPVRGDDGTDDEIMEFFSVGDAPEVYICCDFETYHHLLAARGVPRSLIVWAKETFGMGRGYRRQHEFIGYYGDLDSTTESDLWQIKRAREYEHPTEKPPALAARALLNSTQRNGRVFCPYGGSGDAIMASAGTGRVSYTMEIDPRYCDVIRRRYATYVGDESLMP